MWPNPQDTADLVAFPEENLNGKLYFLCSVCDKVIYIQDYITPIQLTGKQARDTTRPQGIWSDDIVNSVTPAIILIESSFYYLYTFLTVGEMVIMQKKTKNVHCLLRRIIIVDKWLRKEDKFGINKKRYRKNCKI